MAGSSRLFKEEKKEEKTTEVDQADINRMLEKTTALTNKLRLVAEPEIIRLQLDIEELKSEVKQFGRLTAPEILDALVKRQDLAVKKVETYGEVIKILNDIGKTTKATPEDLKVLKDYSSGLRGVGGAPSRTAAMFNDIINLVEILHSATAEPDKKMGAGPSG